MGMSETLRLVLIIIGALILGALLLHGLWTVRKNNGQPKHRYYEDDAAAKPEKTEGFDELGVGQVRVVKKGERPAEAPVAKAPPFKHMQQPKPASTAPVEKRDTAVVTEKSALKTEIQTELPFEEPQEPSLNFSALEQDELPRHTTEQPLNLDVNAEPEPEEEAPAATEPAEVLILYVLLPEHAQMQGPDLLSSLLTLGFKYGEMDIFHRHQDSAGSGPVLFSLANMFNPGTFDLENIDKLSTRGVSLFMTLPGPGEPLGNFNLMHNAAKKLAEEFGGQVLDGQRSVLTVQTVRHYVDKIREFQRQQLIHG